MPEAMLTIELRSDVAIPADSRTIGHPRTRDYIPGRLLLGVAARAIYRHLEEAGTAGGLGGDVSVSWDDAWRLFQTSAVRFLDGLPDIDGVRALPAPKSLHVRKSAGSDQTLFNFIVDGSRAEAEVGGHQPTEAKLQYVNPSLTRKVQVETETSLRTAVGDGGRAAHGLLYSMEVIRAGTVFRARVVAERDEDLELVLSVLAGSHHIGRSRTAELGRVTVTVSRGEIAQVEALPASAQQLSFLAVSPIALRDPETGMPTFVPTPAMFGLGDGWSYDAGRSFVRTDQFSPFHGKRRLPDIERIAIARGSVLTFVAPEPLATTGAQQAIELGIGEYRNEGFGEIYWMNGPLATASVPGLQSVSSRHRPSESSDPNPPAGRLGEWLKVKNESRQAAMDVFDKAKTTAKRFAAWRINAAQWGVIRGMARAARVANTPRDVFIGQLQDVLSHGVAKLEKNWGQKVGSDTASRVLLEEIRGAKDEHAAVFTENLAELVVRAKKSRAKAEQGERV